MSHTIVLEAYSSGGRTLYIIVECAVHVAVLIQEAECIVVAKVLKLNQSILPVPGICFKTLCEYAGEIYIINLLKDDCNSEGFRFEQF